MQVPQVQSTSLNFNYAHNVPPLLFRNTPTGFVPDELSEDGILCACNLKLNFFTLDRRSPRLPALELSLDVRIIGGREDIEFVRAGEMNHVERPVVRERLAHQLHIGVKVTRQRGCQPVNVLNPDRRNQIDIAGSSRDTMNRTRERSTDQIRDVQRVERLDQFPKRTSRSHGVAASGFQPYTRLMVSRSR